MTENKDKKIWARNTAVSIHDETADWFAGQHKDEEKDYFSSDFTYGRKQIEKIFYKEIAKLPKGAKILDVGCGTGDDLKKLFDAGFNVAGVEPSENMLKYAQGKLPNGTIVRGNALKLPFEDNFFDFVSAIEVFRYLNGQDNLSGFEEILRVLKPGGIFFGTFINKYALNGFPVLNFLRKLNEYFFKKPLRFHSEFETPGKIKSKLLSCGFSQVQAHGIMFAPLLILYRINKNIGSFFARILEPADPFLSDTKMLQPFANHLIAIAKK